MMKLENQEKESMEITTAMFGTLEIESDRIIRFDEGLPGFEHLTQFFIVILDQTRPFMWLQAVEEDVSIPVISPFDVCTDYAPTVDDGIFKVLNLEREEDLLVLVVAVIPPEVNLMTANLAAPILINIEDNSGRQVLVEGDEFQIRHPIFESICHLLSEGGSDAGTDATEG